MAGNNHELTVNLKANVDPGYVAAFQNASAKAGELRGQMDALQATAKNISSYERQQAAVEATKEKLNLLNAQYSRAQEQAEAAGDGAEHWQKQLAKLQGQINATEVTLQRQERQLGNTEERLKAAGVDTKDLASETKRLEAAQEALEPDLEAANADLREQEKRLEGAAAGGERFESVLTGALERVGHAMTDLVRDGLRTLGEAMEESISIAMEFEAQMSVVESILLADEETMARLADKAREAGATSVWTATQSGQAMEYMAMAGWNDQQIMDGLAAVMDAAAASGKDLAATSDIVTDALTAFGLQAEDTGHFVDVLAMTSTKSNTNIAMMGETFKETATLAGAMNYTIEDAALAIGLMANAGTKGSRAGTALKNIISNLVSPTDKQAAAMKKLKIAMEDANGDALSFSEVVQNLRRAFSSLSETEKAAYATTLAGKYGMAGLLAIVNSTDEAVEQLRNSITNCNGAAAQMAETRLDNLAGDITLANSAMEALQTTIGEQFNPELRALTQFKTELLNGLNAFIRDNPVFAKGIMAGAVAFGTLGTAIVGVNTAIKVFKALKLASLFTGPAGVLLGVAGGISVVTGAVVGLVDAFRDGGPAVRELTVAAREANDAMEDAKDALEDTMASNLAAANVAERYIDKLEKMGDVTQLSGDKQKEYQNTLALLLQVMPSLSDCISQTADEYGRVTYALNTSTDALRANTEEWKENAKAQAYQEYVNTLMEQYGDVLLEAARNEIGLTKAQNDLEEATDNYNAAVARRNELWAEAEAEAARQREEYGALGTAEDYVTREYYDLNDASEAFRLEMIAAQDDIDAHKKAIERDAEAVAEAEDAINAAQDAVEHLTGVIDEQTDAEREAARQTTELNTVIGDTMTQIASLAEAYEEAYDAAYSSISGQYDLWDEVKEAVATDADSINKAMESQIDYWQKYNTNLEALGERTGDIEGLSDLIASFADGSTDSVNAIAGMAKASDEELATMVENWKLLQEEQEAASGSIADLKTDFSNTMDELQRALAEDIEAMDLGKEAKEAGRATIQGYLDAASEMLSDVQSAYSTLAYAARRALAGGAYSGSYFDIPGHAFASGTDSAPPGLALVGENGPELVIFNGGEKVLNAAQTSALRAETGSAARAAGTAYLSAALPDVGWGDSYTFAPVLQIEVKGNADESTVRQTWSGIERELDRWWKQKTLQQRRMSFA